MGSGGSAIETQRRLLISVKSPGRADHRPAVSWHRGGSENELSATEAAFNDAATRGAEFIEVDVRKTADGILVCVHDDTVANLGRVDELHFNTLGDDRGSILTYDNFVVNLNKFDPTQRTGIHLDLKDTGYELDAVDVWGTRALFVTTPHVSSIALLRHERPLVAAYQTIGSSRRGLSRSARVRLRWRETFPMGELRRCGASGIAIHYRLATVPLRWWCRRHGLAIVVWTVDRDSDLDIWLHSNVDVVTTNRPMFALQRRAVR